jgi:hypothetical protein
MLSSHIKASAIARERLKLAGIGTMAVDLIALIKEKSGQGLQIPT